MILEDLGYSVDMIEFVDFEQSPKNLMIRAKKCKIPQRKNRDAIISLIERYGFSQALWSLTQDLYGAK